MKKGLKEQDIKLKTQMTEDEMEIYLLKNGFDLGEGVCEPGKEHLYLIDSTLVVEHAIDLGYQVSMLSSEVNSFEISSGY